MRYAFRAASFFALCLMLTPAFSLSARAQEDGGPARASERASKSSSEASTKASAASRPAPGAARHSGTEQASADHARDGWVKVESGSRQAYVGIHGGTAPLSLMRSTDGVLFAFTGQTGNDFAQVLKGGNGSRTSLHHPNQNDTEDEAPAMAQADQTPAAKSVPAGPDRQVAPQATAQRPETGTPGSAAPAVSAKSRPTDAGVNAGKAAKPTPAAQAKTVAGSAPAASKAAPSGKGQPPATSENLVFASGELASKSSSEGYQPFGLTPPADASPDATGKASASATPAAPLGKPLKLRSYQQILDHSGSV